MKAMASSTIDISIHGIWHTVPAVEIDGTVIAVTGKWLRVAVIHDEDFLDTDLPDPELCITRLKARSGTRADIFTFGQKLPDCAPQYDYPMEWDSVAAVRTADFRTWWNNLPQESRKNVRRAQKRGVHVVVKPLDNELIGDIVDLNNDCPIRQRKRFVHYGKTFDQVKKDQAAFLGRSAYICAYYENQLIGFLKMAYRGNVAAIVQILPRVSHHDKRPANALLAKAVEVCEGKGVQFLTYGLFSYGKRRDSPLRQFKVRNGFEEFIVPRYYVPLTLWGRVCHRTGLHRGVISVAPGWLMDIAARARAHLDMTRQGRCSSKAEQPNLSSADGAFESSRRLQS